LPHCARQVLPSMSFRPRIGTFWRYSWISVIDLLTRVYCYLGWLNYYGFIG
jgi:hypothetical protein